MKKLPILILFLSAITWSSLAQRTLTGTITSAKGTPLIGATVLVDGTTTGAITDAKGTFELTIPKKAKYLKISYTGYESQRIEIGASNLIDVVLKEDILGLEEIVVVGYGTQLRSNITGNVAKLEGEEIEALPVTDIQSALQGRVAGVHITKSNGKTGGAIKVRIRGTTSLDGINEPLYVVDGIMVHTISNAQLLSNAITNTLADLNFNDIESVEVLKDAAATAIYGSRASNGVILITTKKGVVGKAAFSLDISTGFSKPTRKRDWLNAEQYLELWEEAFNNVADQDGLFFGADSKLWKDTYIPGWDGGYDSDWQEEAFNDNAGFNQVQLGISGGSDRTKYYISGNLVDETGILIKDDYQRIGGRLNLTHKASERMNVGINMSQTRSVNNRLLADNAFASPMQMVAIPPVQPVYDPDNPEELFTNTLWFNTKLIEENTKAKNIVYRNFSNVFLDWKPIEKLSFHTDFGIDFLSQSENLFWSSKMVEISGQPGGIGQSAFLHAFTYVANNYLSYQSDFGESNLEITTGMSYQESVRKGNWISAINFPSDHFQEVASAGEIGGASGWEGATAIVSYFGRVNYNYGGKYLFSLTGRIDGDSRFGSNNRYGAFPAASLGWILSKEGFLENNDFLSFLKLRTSYGLSGNPPNRFFPNRSLFTGGRTYNNQPAFYQSQVANPDIRWEKIVQFNVGLDFGLLNDRISAQVDYYVKNSKDLLLLIDIPSTSGFKQQLQNVGSLENKGFELVLQTYNLTGAFKWKTSLNFARNRNKLTNIYGQNLGSGINRGLEGYPIGVFSTPEYAGVDPENGDALYYLNTTEGDRSTTNNINEAESVVVGDPNPDFIYGVTNEFSYKGFQLSVFFQGVQGADVYNRAGRWQMDGFGWFDNQDARILDRWQQAGDLTDIPQLRFGGVAPLSSRWVEDGSFLRLKNISLSYQLPENLLENFPINRLNIYVTGHNLLTITKYNGWDPEVNIDYSRSNFAIGSDYYSAPQAKRVVFGVKVEF